MMDLQQNIDLLWLYISAALIFIMQAGFLCLESGLTQRKNNINVAIKKLADFCLTIIIYWVFSFAVMFGMSASGWIGTSHFSLDFLNHNPTFTAFFIYQAMLCAVAVAVMSGATSERLSLSSGLILTTLVVALVYPVYGHWAWAGLDKGEALGWLNRLGFVDFAGSSVVHSIGGWASLAVLLIIGPRADRFDEQGNSHRIFPANLTMATFGAVLLFIGWIGFNGGNTLSLNRQVSLIIVNTIIAGAVGAISAGILGYAVKNKLSVIPFINGCLGGLVSISASCFAVSTHVAALIGLVGGMITIGIAELLKSLKIDDAVNAIPVHLGAGIWGTLAVGLYADLDILGTGLSRIEQIGIQILGIVVCAIWASGITYAVISIINRFRPLRVSRANKLIGLNSTEHHVRKELGQNHNKDSQHVR